MIAAAQSYRIIVDELTTMPTPRPYFPRTWELDTIELGSRAAFWMERENP